MASRQQLEDALIAAHEAGDTEAATLFASEIKSLGQTQPSAADSFAGDALLSNNAMSDLSAGVPMQTSKPLGAFDRFVKYGKKYTEGLSNAEARMNAASPTGGLGTLEAIGTLATGGIAAPMLGTAEAMALGTDPEKAFARYTYQPRTESGKAQLGMLGALAAPLTESGADIALGPIIASESQVLRSAARMKPKEVPLIPSTNELKRAATQAYAAGKAAGVVVKPENYTKALGRVQAMVQEEGVDPTLHPKSTAVLKRLQDADGQPLTLQQAETLRKIALDAEDDLNPVTREPTPDARLAGKIVDELDDSIEELSVNDPARDIYKRAKRSQMIDRAIERARINAGANYTQAGMEHALRQEFKKLALNPRRMRGLSTDQRAAIEKVATGGRMENFMRNLGKFDPTTGGMAAFIGTGAGGALGGALGGIAGGGIGSLALPAAGFLGKRAATRMTASNVDAAREALVGRGMPAPAQVQAAMPASSAVSGELMPRKPLALPAPSIIAGSRSAPGTAFAREQMGMTPDVERAGALHPGAARESLMPRQPALPQRAAPGLLGDQRPMVVDSQGRVAAMREELQSYLRDSGQERMRNVRQPAANPMSRGLLAPEDPAPAHSGLLGSATRLPDEIRQDLKKLDAKLQRLPEDEPSDSPRMKSLETEWVRLRAELAAAESRAESP